MFLTRMVNELFDLNKNDKRCNHSQSQQPQHQSSTPLNPFKKTNKSQKKADKRKQRSEPKKTLREFFNTAARDISGELPQSSGSKVTSNTEGTLKSLPPIKVKSGSWKRSEKASPTFNALPNKKPKAARRRSPNWLKLSNTPVKIKEKIINASATTSVCRPGTLYSDVLFAAGSSSLVKVKTLTPRRCGNTAQLKLTQALFKCADRKKSETHSVDSDIALERDIFPSLHQLSHSKTASSGANLSSPMPCSKTTSVAVSSHTGSQANSSETSVFPSSKGDSCEGPDVVILSDRNDSQIAKTELSYGNYLEQQFDKLSICGVINASSSLNTGSSLDQVSSQQRSPFRVDIPQWNYTEVDIYAPSYPKLMCQFDDESYLELEKLALLSLNLALGYQVGSNNFKL